MKGVEKLKTLSSKVLNEKDYNLILKFIEKHNFDSFTELILSEIKKEYKLCKPEQMTERYTTLQELYFELGKYDINKYFEVEEKNYDDWE